jgi:C4-dicarboxylate-specific signal transduction histidine kinase
LISTWGQVERSVGGKPLLVRGVSMDITERKQAESERIQLRSELAHLGRVMTMSELSAYLAHEINQPLGAILNNASAARTLNSKLKEGSAEFGEILADIIADATRAGEIIRKVRGIMIKGEAKFELLNLNILIERVVELYRNMLNIEKTLVSLDLQPDLSPIRGDRIQLQQVLMNLVSNAIENMTQSSPKKLSILSTMQSPDMITVSVSDSGTGVDEANKDKVFQPFFTTKKDGMGMGLRICQSIIEEHSGRIWVENNPAGGATFSFSLISHQGDSK